jgi:tRNA threonylcarbamoyladenosine biosynthesis protein TsaB
MAGVLILAIETATGCGGVALTRGISESGTLLAEYTLQPEVTHSRQLLGSIAAIMAAAGTDWSQLAAVAVSQGPGSFTGLRIGMAAAKGIARAAGIPLLAVPTLDGLALQTTTTELPLCCLLDARKQQVYAAFYRHEEGRCRRTSPFLVLRPEELVRQIHEPTLVIGPGVQACQSLLATHPPVRLCPGVFLCPRAAAIGFCGAQQLEEEAGDEYEEIVPLYVRASEAELSLRGMDGRMQGAL